MAEIKFPWSFAKCYRPLGRKFRSKVANIWIKTITAQEVGKVIFVTFSSLGASMSSNTSRNHITVQLICSIHFLRILYDLSRNIIIFANIGTNLKHF